MKTITESRTIVIFPGRFQPWHLGHQCFYEHLCEKFGKQNVYIASSNIKGNNSPLSFTQKKRIATKFFGVPSNRFIKCAKPYSPEEILEKFDRSKTSLVLALGGKDRKRLSESEYFQTYPKKIVVGLRNCKEMTYVYSGPMFANNRCGTDIREQFKGAGTLQQKKLCFLKMFGSFDQKLFEALIKH